MRANDDAQTSLLDGDESPRQKAYRPGSKQNRLKWVAVALLFAVVVIVVVYARAAAVVVISNGRITMHVLPTGAIIQRLYVPDKEGTLADISLGFEDAEVGRYTDGTSPYFGAVVGRVANRVANATFSLDGRSYHLATNENGFPGSLHGGKRGWDKVAWTAVKVSAAKVKLTYRSPDGEEGYPGAVEATVIYSLTEANELVIEMSATTDVPTPINMAQHACAAVRLEPSLGPPGEASGAPSCVPSYFNLGGHGSGSILEHELTLPGAAHVLPVDAARIPTGEFKAVKGGPYDFLTKRTVGSSIGQVDGPGWKGGYDNCYVLHNLGSAARAATKHGGVAVDPPRLAAKLRHPPSGRTMEILTTAPGLQARRSQPRAAPASGRRNHSALAPPGQVYTGNFLDGSIHGKGGAAYHKYAGICLETQGFPNAVNNAAFPSCIVGPAREYRHTSIYRFSAE